MLVTDGMYLVDRFNYIVSIATAPKLYPEGNLFIRLEFQLDVISFSFFFLEPWLSSKLGHGN